MSQNILVIKHGALGDFFIAMGAFRAIRDHHKDDHLSVLTSKAYQQLAKDTGFFDAVLVDDRPSLYNLPALLRLRSSLREKKLHRVYDLQNSPRTSWYFKLLGPGQRPEWNGIAPGCSHPQVMENRRKTHAYPRFKDQLAVAGIAQVPWPDLSWVKADISRFNLASPYVLLVPGSSPTRLLKRWPGNLYGAFALSLWSQGITPVIIGGADEEDAIAAIKEVCPSVLDLSGQTSLYEIIQLARGAQAVVGNDTGPLHMASIAKCPTLVLWSNASDPTVFAPQGDHVMVEQEDNLKDLSLTRVESAFEALMNKKL